MKRNIKRIFALLLAASLLCTGSVFAASAKQPAPTVRVNGNAVSFPDGQPFVDANNRTMIPVRFVSEELGAKVTWNGATQSAVIEKDGIQAVITIGSEALKVTRNGSTSTVTMDTAAVLKDGRTYVPIRYVAEALGAFVDYSALYSTVGIYADELTAAEISDLRAYPYTQPEDAVGYEEAKKQFSSDTLAFCYGTVRDKLKDFANAHEYLYHTLARTGKYYFNAIGKTMNGGTSDEFYENVIQETIAEVSYQSERLTVSFRTDNACIYQADTMDSLTTAVRGIATATPKVAPADLTGAELAMLTGLGFTQLAKGKEVSIAVDVHMNTQPDCRVYIHTIVPLGEAK